MATVTSAPEQRVVLRDVSWKMYEDLLAAQGDSSVPRFTYDRGALEIMSPSAEHDYIKDTLAMLVNVLAEELEINAEGYGSTTFRRKDLARGFEPDACFYIANADRVKGKLEFDLRTDPPPDLVIEVDITSPSVSKFPLFAQLGVPEVWLHDGVRALFFVLVANDYAERTISTVLPGVTAEAITRFLDESRALKRLPWLRRVREWAKGVKG